MSFTATVSHDVVMTPTAGTPTSLSLNRVGQNGRVTFTGTAGGAVAVQIGGITTVPVGRAVYLTVLKPDGNTLTWTYTPSGYTFNLTNLPTTGTYTLFVDPQYGATANLILNVVPSGSAAVVVDGATSAVNTTATPGAYAYFSFTATAGENLGLVINNIVKVNGNPSYPHVDMHVYKPNGTEWLWRTGSDGCFPANGGCELNLTNIPTIGVYSVVVISPLSTPEPNLTMSFTATVSHDVVMTPTVGAATSLNLGRGQNGRISFTGTAGAALVLQVGGITTTPSCNRLYLTVLKPDGAALTATYTVSGTTINLPTLPVTGSYTLFVDPQYGAAANMQVMRQ
jgi:hypothetical protein